MNPTSDHRQAPDPADPTGPCPPPPTSPSPPLPTDAWSRRRAAILAGHAGDTLLAGALLADPDPAVRVAAVGAMARSGLATRADVVALAADPDALVRRRVAEELGRASGVDVDRAPSLTPVGVLTGLVGDPDPLVAETAAWALGEWCAPGPDDSPGEDPGSAAGTVGTDPLVVATLAGAAGGHVDALVREAAVAALGAIGDPGGLDAVLAATSDRPAIRRRAVLALAAFWGEPGVAEAVARAASDRDWQVRDAARLVGGDTPDAHTPDANTPDAN